MVATEKGRAGPPFDRAQRSARRWEWLILAAITLLAAFLRLYKLQLLPPGIHFDEAVYGLQGEYIYQGHLPIFFEAYTGREPLYMYLAALVYLFTKPGTYGLRLTSALIGVLTVPASYLALRELTNRRTAMLAAVLIAGSYWHLNVTRTGFCWTLMPLVESVAIYFLWRGYRRGEMWALALGGVASAAMLYIYLSGRFFPFTLLLILLYLWVVDRAGLRARWRGLLLMFGIAVLVVSPLAWYFYQHPHDLWERADQVLVFTSGAGSALRVILDKLLHILPTFFPRLANEGRYAFQGRPALDVLIGPFFWLGLAVALWRCRRPAYGVLVLWWLGMCLPPVFTVEPYPVDRRIFGIIPALYGLVAVGLEQVWRWAAKRKGWRVAVPTLIAVLLCAETVWSGIYYFTVWAPSRSTYYKFHSDVVDAARVAGKSAAEGKRLIIASEHYRHPSAAITNARVLEAKWAQGKHLVVLPAWDGRPIDYVVPIFDAKPIAPAVEVLQSLSCSKDEFVATIGDPVVETYHICQQPQVDKPTEPRAILADELTLWSVQVPAQARRDEPVRVAIQWEVRKTVDAPRSFSVHLVDAQGLVWAQVDEIGYIPQQWEVGDYVWQWLDVPLPEAIPPGEYKVRLIYSGENATPLVVHNAQGVPSGTYVLAGQVELTAEGATLSTITPDEDNTLAGQAVPVHVAAWERVEADLRPGEKVVAAVTWQLDEPTTAEAEVELDLWADDGALAATWRYALATAYPLRDWQKGERVAQRYQLALPTELAAGHYVLTLGLAGSSETLSVGDVDVAGLARLMELPPIQHSLAQPVTLGGSVHLLGYDLEAQTWDGAAPLNLTLYWQALVTPERDLTVFVHVLNGAGEIVWQQDIAPAEGARPTSGWIAGEVVVDGHTLQPASSLPVGEYTLAVGLYDPDTMVRLELLDASGGCVANDRLLLAQLQVVAQ